MVMNIFVTQKWGRWRGGKPGKHDESKCIFICLQSALQKGNCVKSYLPISLEGPHPLWIIS